MTTISSSEAPGRFVEVLRSVAKGDRVVITENGIPVAVVVPPAGGHPKSMLQAINEMLTERDQRPDLPGDSSTARELIDEGRRF
jgi:prevent-host-death family protein